MSKGSKIRKSSDLKKYSEGWDLAFGGKMPPDYDDIDITGHENPADVEVEKKRTLVHYEVYVGNANIPFTVHDLAQFFHDHPEISNAKVIGIYDD